MNGCSTRHSPKRVAGYRGLYEKRLKDGMDWYYLRSQKGGLVPRVYNGSVEAIVCHPIPNSEEEARWLAREVSASICFVASNQRKQSRIGLERSNPEKAAAVLTEMARGTSQLRTRSKFKISGKVIDRLVRDHQELLERTLAWRAETSSRLAVKASRAFEEKLDRILDDVELLNKTSLRELVLAYQVTLDQQRTALAACPTPTRTTRVTLEDARKAIEKARAGPNSIHPSEPYDTFI